MPTSSRATIGVAVFSLLALLDLSWLVQRAAGLVSGADAPPIAVLILFALFGVATLVAARPALGGQRSAGWVMAGSRVVSALVADLPALFLSAPGWIKVVASAAIALTVLGLWWTAPLLRSGRPVGARTQPIG